jgi:hypothetical protein
VAEPVDVTATILREMRDEMRDRFDRLDKRMHGLEGRMDGPETGLQGVQIILVNGMGSFDQRIASLESKVR